jgi:hypothetical protein
VSDVPPSWSQLSFVFLLRGGCKIVKKKYFFVNFSYSKVWLMMVMCSFLLNLHTAALQPGLIECHLTAGGTPPFQLYNYLAVTKTGY